MFMLLDGRPANTTSDHCSMPCDTLKLRGAESRSLMFYADLEKTV